MHRWAYYDIAQAYVCELCGQAMTEENKQGPCPQAPVTEETPSA